MKITTCNGDDQHLFHWVGDLIMDKSVLKYNNNYPFRTSDKYTWHIAYDDTRVLGFMPVEHRRNRSIINNYYIAGDDPEVLRQLTQHVMDTHNTLPVEAVAQTRHAEAFQALGFEPQLTWKKYIKMLYGAKQKS